jgi:hypothetical protein
MIDVGLGAAEALAVPGTGRVVGAYGKAAYLSLPGGLVALTGLDVHRGPMHVRAPVRCDRLRVGDRVVVTPTALGVGPVLVDLHAARPWQGALPAATALRDAVTLLADAPPSSLPIPPPVDLLRAGELPRVAASLGGLGPGLTPAGDDCLAGILLVARILWGDPIEPPAARTNDIARAFLGWAARGQSIEPVHDFLMRAAAGDRTGAKAALVALTRVGHSSGADLALGLRLALDHLPRDRHISRPCNAGAMWGVHAPASSPTLEVLHGPDDVRSPVHCALHMSVRIDGPGAPRSAAPGGERCRDGVGLGGAGHHVERARLQPGGGDPPG